MTNTSNPTPRSAPAPAPGAEDPAAVIGLGGRPARRRRLLLGALALATLAALGGWAWLAQRSDDQRIRYLTEPVTRADLQLKVVANGSLQATRTVNIGSELSGTIKSVFVDVNDRVRKGQVLMELDTAKLRDQIARSRAALAAAEAQVLQARATAQEATAGLARLEEVRRLSGGKVPADTELDAARAALARAQAAEASARAGVAEAQATVSTDTTNLGRASIRSPIDGVVLTRNADAGNAVAASLQAVTLFTLAEDLERLKLQVNVDEADVSGLQAGQRASFTVSSQPNRAYPAEITRVAYASTTTDNVVTFATQLSVDNADLSLRPGMTATATIVAQEQRGVLSVPNTALRYTPTQTGEAGGARAGSSVLSRLMPRPPGGAAVKKAKVDGSGSGATRRIWLLQDGQPAALAVVVGISDGRRTEVRAAQPGEAGRLHAGAAVIVDQALGGGASGDAAGNTAVPTEGEAPGAGRGAGASGTGGPRP